MSFFPNVVAIYVFKRKVGEYEAISATHKVVNNRIILKEAPDAISKVKIIGYTEVEETIVNETDFKVDYSYGYVYFHSSKEGLDIPLSYLGTGMVAIPSSRVFIDEGDSSPTKTLNDIVVDANEKIATTTQLIIDTTQVKNDTTQTRQDILDDYEEVVSQTKIIILPLVEFYADIATTYPNPLLGYTVQVKADGIEYRYDGTVWQPFRTSGLIIGGEIVSGAVPPENTNVIWLDTSTLITKFKKYNATSLAWEEIKPATKFDTYRNTVTLAENVGLVNIGIAEFNSQDDALFVVANSVSLTEGEDYTIHASGISIVKLSGTWNSGTVFNFTSLKTERANHDYSDGSLISAGSVTDNQLAVGIRISPSLTDKSGTIHADLRDRLLDVDTKVDSNTLELTQIPTQTYITEKAKQTDLDATNTQMAQTASEVGDASQRTRQSVWSEFENRAVNVKWFEHLIPNKEDVVSQWDWSIPIQSAIVYANTTSGEVFFPRGSYRTTQTIVINVNAIKLTANLSGNSNDFTRAASILYDGPPGGDIILIGQYGTGVSRNPIIIENLVLNGNGKCRWGIYTNRTNINSEIRNCFFRDCIGFLKADSCYYMDIINNTFRSVGVGEVSEVITSTIWNEVSKGLIQLNVANNVIFEKNTILRTNITYNGASPTALIYSNRQESFKVHMNTIEDCSATYLISIGESSAGNNFEVSHLYIEIVKATAIINISGYSFGDVEVKHIHLFNTHLDCLFRSGSANYKGEVNVSFIEMRSGCSLRRLFVDTGASTSFNFSNCFLATGEWSFIEGVALVEPFDGTNGTYDNRLGIEMNGRNKTYPSTGESYIDGLTNIIKGSDLKGSFIDVLYDGEYGMVCSKPVRLCRSTGTGSIVQRLRPSSDGTWFLYLTIFQTLFLTKITTDFNTVRFATPIAKFDVNGGEIIGSIDSSVKRPRGLYSSTTAQCIILRASNPQSEDVTWRTGDYAQNTLPIETGSTGSKYIVRGWSCVTGGRGNASLWVADRGLTGN